MTDPRRAAKAVLERVDPVALIDAVLAGAKAQLPAGLVADERAARFLDLLILEAFRLGYAAAGKPGVLLALMKPEVAAALTSSPDEEAQT